MESRMKKAQGVKSVDDLDHRYLNSAQQRVYDSGMSELTQSALWSQATDEQQEKTLKALYNIALGNEAGKKLDEKIQAGASVGIDQTDYLLYQTALQMADDGNGSYKMEETEAALRSMTWLTDAERAYLFSLQHPKAKSNPFAAITRGGSMHPEMASTSNRPSWAYTRPRNITGQAPDVTRGEEGLNPYGVSQQGFATKARQEFEQTLGGDVYRKMWDMAMDAGMAYDVIPTLEYIAKDREAQLYKEKAPAWVPDDYYPDAPVERLTAAMYHISDLEKDPVKKKLLEKLYDILGNGVENGDLARKDSELNKLLWKLGF